MKRLLVFDLDGTLVDSLEDIRYALNSALREAGLPEHDSASVRRMVGHGLGELVKAALPAGRNDDQTREAVLAGVRRVYAGTPFRFSRPYPGMVELVAKLRAGGEVLAVLTNKAHDIAAVIVEHFFAGMFHAVQGESAGSPRKPDARAVETLFDRLRGAGTDGQLADFEPRRESTVLIGDGDADVKTALNAGIRVIAAGWGFRTVAELAAAGADTFAANAEELSELLNGEAFR
jgi:phosphoglycolate phosphatase